SRPSPPRSSAASVASSTVFRQFVQRRLRSEAFSAMPHDRDATAEGATPPSGSNAVAASLIEPPAAAPALPTPQQQLPDRQVREQFLSRVGDVLNSSLDYRATIQSIARLCTGFL